MFSKPYRFGKQLNSASPLQRGVAMVEMAIVMPVLATIMIALIDGGIMLVNYMTLTQIAHEGVRMGSSMSDLDSVDRTRIISCSYNSSLCWGQTNHGVANASTNELLPIAWRVVELANIERFPFRGEFFVEVEQDDANEQISVSIEATYNSFFRFFDNVPIRVHATGPYLFN